MPDESSTFGLNREKLGKLWKMGAELPEKKTDSNLEIRKAKLLQSQLSESLPLDEGMHHLLPDIFTVVCEKLKPFTGCSFKDLVMDPQTDPVVLETIKNYHKKQAQSISSEMGQEIAAIIYYTAIASALVHHDTRITKLSYKDLSRSFTELQKNNWLLAELKNLFIRAYNKCSKHLKNAGLG